MSKVLPTIIVASIVAIIFVAIIAKGIINRKKGISSCSCGCSGCASKDICHNSKK